MKIRATVTKGMFRAGDIYDWPEKEAMAAIMAGCAEPLVAAAPEERETATNDIREKRKWHTR